jgi:DNA-binding CsgD family transcriptional regulator
MTMQLSQLPDQNQLGLPRHAARAIVLLQEAKGRAQPDLDLLTRTWGLSRAEARTAVSASEGGKLLDVASRLGLSTNTVKTQLQQVYPKTGCASRADLTRIMLSLQ